MATKISVSVFQGISSLPVLIARDKGLFAKLGLSVEVTMTTKSSDLMSGLVDGAFQIVHASPDNFVEWRDRTHAPIVAWMGGASGPVSLVAKPSVGEIPQLAGQHVAVDAVASGYVSLLRRICRRHGLADTDLALDPLGNTKIRFDALLAGETAATMLTLPWATAAVEQGYRFLSDQYDVAPGLQGSAAASVATWATSNPETVDNYYRSICASVAWLQLADHATVSELIANHYSMPARHANAVRDALLNSVTGWPSSAKIDPRGFEVLCELRRENGQPPALDPDAYFTLEPYRRVLGFGLV